MLRRVRLLSLPIDRLCARARLVLASLATLPSLLNLVSLLAGLTTPASARAQQLHEYLPGVSADEIREALQHDARDDQTRHESSLNANAMSSPSESGDAELDGPYSLESSVAPGTESLRPDRMTSLEGSLDYDEAFDPSIAPFKRVTAFNSVRLDSDGVTPLLAVGDTKRRPVPIEGLRAKAPDARPRDRFIGEYSVDFSSSLLQPLPSVSPESRMLSLSTEPAVDVQVERDAADNFYLRARGPIPNTRVRVRWDTDAPRVYFGTDIPTLGLRELPVLPPLDPSIEQRALTFSAELGITPGSDLRDALEKLTQHFRSFVESSDALHNTGDVYWDLLHGGKGLCRHRAYGFVVTARALGIDARFVQNEAHSWVEVRLPELGLMRIDLGGATHGLTAHEASPRARYVPAQPDTLPRPASYRQSYAHAADGGGSPRTPESETTASTPEREGAGRWTRDTPALSQTRADAAADGGNVRPDTSELARSHKPKLPVHILLDDRRINGLRGGKLALAGRVLEADGRGVPGVRTEIWLKHPGQTVTDKHLLLAVQVSDAEGYFHANFGVPHDLPIGDYRISVHSDADATHLPGTSE